MRKQTCTMELTGFMIKKLFDKNKTIAGVLLQAIQSNASKDLLGNANQNTHKNMKHAINEVIEQVINVFAVYVKKIRADSISRAFWLTCDLNHCTITVCVKCIPY